VPKSFEKEYNETVRLLTRLIGYCAANLSLKLVQKHWEEAEIELRECDRFVRILEENYRILVKKYPLATLMYAYVEPKDENDNEDDKLRWLNVKSLLNFEDTSVVCSWQRRVAKITCTSTDSNFRLHHDLQLPGMSQV
jgi:hypothetical protein